MFYTVLLKSGQSRGNTKTYLWGAIKLKILFTFCLVDWDGYPFYLMSVSVNIHAVESVKMDSSELEKILFIF